jgi:hypothetical protein
MKFEFSRQIFEIFLKKTQNLILSNEKLCKNKSAEEFTNFELYLVLLVLRW